MFFSLIKYIQPSWYYNLIPEAEKFSTSIYHPSLNEIKDMDMDERYETESAKYLDLGYRYWWRGGMNTCKKQDFDELKKSFDFKVTLKDQYIFLRKYWKPQWVKYTFLRRLLALNNPIKEVKAYLSTKNVSLFPLYSNPLTQTEYEGFDSTLVKNAPKVSVIIPTLNRYEYLKDVLSDLEKQDYQNFDVIVVDQSESFTEKFYEPYKLNFKLINQKEKLLWTARNRAIKESDAELYLFFDDDSRIDPDWITQHVKCLDFYNADISAGVSIAKVGAKVPQSYSYFRWADQFDSGNALVKRQVFEKIGMFDLQFNKQRMGDGEFGLRAYLAGIKSVSNPLGKRLHLKVPSGGLREIGSWDGFRPKKWFAPKPIPSVVYLYKKYFPKDFAFETVFLGIMMSNVDFKYKSNKMMIIFSLFLAFLTLPKLLIQTMVSNSKANKMLREGDQIEYFENSRSDLKNQNELAL